jgi:hypothetical protein
MTEYQERQSSLTLKDLMEKRLVPNSEMLPILKGEYPNIHISTCYAQEFMDAIAQCTPDQIQAILGNALYVCHVGEKRSGLLARFMQKFGGKFVHEPGKTGIKGNQYTSLESMFKAGHIVNQDEKRRIIPFQMENTVDTICSCSYPPDEDQPDSAAMDLLPLARSLKQLTLEGRNTDIALQILIIYGTEADFTHAQRLTHEKEEPTTQEPSSPNSGKGLMGFFRGRK